MSLSVRCYSHCLSVSSSCKFAPNPVKDRLQGLGFRVPGGGEEGGVGGGGAESTEEHLVQICTHSGSVMFFFVIFFAFFTCQSCQGNWVCPQFDTMKSLNYARVLIEFN